MSSEKKRIGWNKGLTKETDERVKRISENMKINNPMKNKDISKKVVDKRRGEKSYIRTPDIIKKNIESSKKGIPRSEETKIKIHKNALINPNYGMKGKTMSKEGLEKIKNSWNTKERKELAKEIRSKLIIPLRDTSIEIKIQKFLSFLHIEYITHKYISEITNKYQCDIFIREQEGILKKTIIECDGCYWHGCPICSEKRKNKLTEKQLKQIEKDDIRTKELEEKGYKVIRLREHDIKIMELKQFEEVIKCQNY